LEDKRYWKSTEKKCVLVTKNETSHRCAELGGYEELSEKQAQGKFEINMEFDPAVTAELEKMMDEVSSDN
jgi:hypothetical protein